MLDKRILEQLFRRNYSEMIHLARVLLGDDGEAEDVVQETLLRIWQGRDKLEDAGEIQAFGYTVCRRLALDCAGKAGHGNVTLDLDRHDTALTQPSEQMDRQERVALIRKLMDSLPETQRSIMQLRDIEGKTYIEIADILQLTEAQVKVYLHRARTKVREQAEKIEKYGL